MRIKLLAAALTIVIITALIGGYTMAWFADSDATEPTEFSAGTVLIEAGSSSIASQYFDETEGVFVYGVEGKTGDLYEIDVQNKVEHKIYSNPNNYDGFYPNGLAFDEPNDRLYFAANRKDLYFYDFSADELVLAGKFPTHSNRHVYGATFGGGYYWYIPNETGELYKGKIGSDGKIADADWDHVTMTDDYGLHFGDVVIAYADGIIYGSSTSFYFTYNTVTGEFDKLGSKGKDLQLAWGHNGILYGHNTGNRNWYIVEPATGNTTSLFTGERAYNDLAPGSTSYWNPGDCAWAKFNVKNVGTKKSYVRLNLNGYWQEKVDDEWVDWIPPVEGMVTYTFNDHAWVEENGYIYYNEVLMPGETAELKLRVCLSTEAGNEFQGKRFVLTGTFDAIQTTHDAAQIEWGWSPGGTAE